MSLFGFKVRGGARQQDTPDAVPSGFSLAEKDLLDELIAWIDWSGVGVSVGVRPDLDALRDGLRQVARRLRDPDKRLSATTRAAVMDVLRRHGRDHDGFDPVTMCRLARAKIQASVPVGGAPDGPRPTSPGAAPADLATENDALRREIAALQENIAALHEMIDRLSEAPV